MLKSGDLGLIPISQIQIQMRWTQHHVYSAIYIPPPKTGFSNDTTKDTQHFRGSRTVCVICCTDCKAPWGRLWFWCIWINLKPTWHFCLLAFSQRHLAVRFFNNLPWSYYNCHWTYDLEHLSVWLRCQSIRLLHQSQYFLEIQLRGCIHTCDLLGDAVKDEYIIALGSGRNKHF